MLTKDEHDKVMEVLGRGWFAGHNCNYCKAHIRRFIDLAKLILSLTEGEAFVFNKPNKCYYEEVIEEFDKKIEGEKC